MNNQLKQRIIGSIIVVAFLAIAIPFLLSGSKTTPVNPNANSNTEIPAATPASSATNHTTNTDVVNLPLPTEDNANSNSTQPIAGESSTPSAAPVNNPPTLPQINMSTSSTPAAPAVATAVEPSAITTPEAIPTAPVADPTPAATTAVAAVNNAPATSIASENKAAPQNPALQASLAQKEAEVLSTQTTHKIIAKNKKTKSTITTSIKTKTAKTTIKNQQPKNLVVSAGVYQDEAKAKAVLKKLHTDNYHNASIQKTTIKNKIKYRVIAGNATTQEKAEFLAKRVEKNLKIKAAIIPMANTHLNAKTSLKALSTKHQHKK